MQIAYAMEQKPPCRYIFRISLTQYESNIRNCFLGFTNGDSTWLPVNESYNVINVEDQLLDETSPLETYKAVVQIRRCHEDLILWGATSFFSQVSTTSVGNNPHRRVLDLDKCSIF